jgi:cellobiose phosphorylase
MQYGHFDDEQREYVITNPKTPAKWINYIGTLAFGGFIDHTGGALLCRGDPAQNRITRYVQQMPSSDFKGTTLYLRIPDGEGGYRVFSPLFVPTLDAYDSFECRVGLGYSRFVSVVHGIETNITVFVPRGDDVEIRTVKVTNATDASVEVDCIPVVEYSHPNATLQFTNADWVPQTMVSRAYEDADGTRVLIQYPFMNRDAQVNYFTSNHAASSFETDRKRFLGDNEYGTWAVPAALRQQELSNAQANRGDNIAALMHHLGTLAPGESRELTTILGQAASLDAARPTIAQYRDPRAVAAAFDGMIRFWDEYLGAMQVDTPDDSMNHMLNVHHPRQCYITKNWSRYLSYYQLGYGARGIGFRDSSQDVLGVLAGAPAEGRDLILKLLQIQRRDGAAYHSVNPLSMEASVGEAHDTGTGIPFYGDDHLWIVLAVCEYLKETGEYAFLDAQVAYYDTDDAGRKIESGTVMDHLLRAIEFTRTHVGAHGLPLLGFADWNDCVNLPWGAESLFIANLYGRALYELIALSQHRTDAAMEATCRGYYEAMKAVVNEQAWDGAWYARYFDKDGNVLGSRTNDVCRIYCNGQSWPVFSGFAVGERATQALDSLREHLNTSKGIKAATPGYDGFVPGVGGITTYPPGAKENCGIFLHTNPWVMIAETMVGRGERAFEYYDQINPAAKNDIIDEYEIEPYAYAQNILGDEHPQFGLGRNSWLSGTAAWVYHAATKYILGVRPEHGGLKIDPCIPPAWDGFSATRRFRGATYRITVKNPEHVSKGRVSLTVDGSAVHGAIVPVFADGEVHDVAATMTQ